MARRDLPDDKASDAGVQSVEYEQRYAALRLAEFYTNIDLTKIELNPTACDKADIALYSADPRVPFEVVQVKHYQQPPAPSRCREILREFFATYWVTKNHRLRRQTPECFVIVNNRGFSQTTIAEFAKDITDDEAKHNLRAWGYDRDKRPLLKAYRQFLKCLRFDIDRSRLPGAGKELAEAYRQTLPFLACGGMDSLVLAVLNRVGQKWGARGLFTREEFRGLVNTYVAQGKHTHSESSNMSPESRLYVLPLQLDARELPELLASREQNRELKKAQSRLTRRDRQLLRKVVALETERKALIRSRKHGRILDLISIVCVGIGCSMVAGSLKSTLGWALITIGAILYVISALQ